MSPDEPFGLVVQRLASDTERVLVLAEVAGVRNGDLKFATRDIIGLFDSLRVPQPSNTSARLSQLRSGKLVVRSRDGSWALTPQGRVRAQGLVGKVDESVLGAQLSRLPGADFDGVRHSTVPPILAPLRWSRGVARLLESHPFEQNVFLMTRFPGRATGADLPDPLEEAIEVIQSALSGHGLLLHRADDRQVEDELLGNVTGFMWACQYGIGVVEDRVGRGVNQNVLIELGGMLMTGRRCAILKDTEMDVELPTDLIGQIYKPVNLEDLEAVNQAVHAWVARDLALGTCSACD